MLILLSSLIVGILSAAFVWLFTGRLKDSNMDSAWQDIFLRIGATFAALVYGAVIFGGDPLRQLLAH